METLRNRLTESRDRFRAVIREEATAWGQYARMRMSVPRPSLPQPVVLERRILTGVDARLERVHRRVTSRLAELDSHTKKARAARVVDWPIADYDRMKARDVVPKLEGLGVRQLRDVERYEREHKARKTVLEAIAELLS